MNIWEELEKTDFDTFEEEEEKKKQESIGNIWDSIDQIEFEEPTETILPKLYESTYYTNQINPEIRGRSLAIQDEANKDYGQAFSVEEYETDIDLYETTKERDKTFSAIDWGQVPTLTGRLQDIVEGPIYRGDEEKLAEMETLESDVAAFQDSTRVQQAFAIGQLQTITSTLEGVEIFRDLTEEEDTIRRNAEKRLKLYSEPEFLKQLSDNGYFGKAVNWVANIPTASAEQFGQQVERVKGAAGEIGEYQSSWATRFDLVGQAIQVPEQMFLSEAGSAKKEFSALRDDHGNPYPEQVVNGAAITYGVLSSGVELGGGALLGMIGGKKIKEWAKGKTAKAAIKQLMSSKWGMSLLGKVGTTFATASAFNGAEEAVQQAIQGTIRNAIISTGGDVKMTSVSELTLESLNAFSYGAQGGGGQQIVQSAPFMMAEYWNRKANDKYIDNVEAAVTGAVKDSKTAERNPDRFQQYVTDVVKDHGASPTVGVSAESLESYMQAEEITVEQLNEVMPEVAQSFKEAILSGGEVQIETGLFFKTFARNEAFMQKASGDVRYHSVMPTKNEAVEMQKRFEEVQKAPEFNKTLEVFKEKLAEVASPDVADTQAQLMTHFFLTVGKKAGLTEDEMLNSVGWDVVQDSVASANLEKDIMLVQTDKGPTPEQMYGPSLQEFMDAGGTVDQAVAEGYFEVSDVQSLMPEDIDAAVKSETPIYAAGKENVKLVEQAQRLEDVKKIAEEAGVDLTSVTAAEATEIIQSRRLEQRVGEDSPRISTRYPAGAQRVQDPEADTLEIDTESAKMVPASFNKNMDVVKGGMYDVTLTDKTKATVPAYVGFNTRKRKPDTIAEDYINFVADNLTWIYDLVPEEIRERSKLWYDGANKIANEWADKYEIEPHAVAAVMAALSPQKDWFQNVSLAERVLDIMSYVDENTVIGEEHRAFTEALFTNDEGIFSDKNRKVVDALIGTPMKELTESKEMAAFIRVYDELNNTKGYRVVTPEGDFVGPADGNVAWGSLEEIGKAVVVLSDSSVENINRSMGNGHKIRNFYNNIIDPANARDVTIDTHAVAAGLLRPMSSKSYEVGHNFGSGAKGGSSSKKSGAGGVYGLNADAYRKAAKDRGVSAREMQSITWEAVRGLFSDKFKVKHKATAMADKTGLGPIDKLWEKYDNTPESLAQIRQEIIDYAEGITSPDWYGRDPSVYGQAQDSSYTGELSGTSLPAGATGRLRAGAGGGAASGTTRLFQDTSGEVGRPTAKTRPILAVLRRQSGAAQGASGAYTRSTEGAGGDSGLLGRFTPSEELAAAYESVGITPVSVNEITDGAAFHQAMQAALENHPVGAQVEVKSVEEYSSGEYRLFLTEDSQGGFAMRKSDGDLVSLFNNPDTGPKNFGYQAVALGIDQGATKLDAYAGFLTTIYSRMGFAETARYPWDDQYMPEGWDKDELGEPDVVEMELDLERMYKEDPGVTRGFIDMGQNRDYFRITLTGNANLSTFLHESGHMFLEVFQNLAIKEGADPSMQADLDIIKGWVGWEEGQTRFTRDQHEQWARGFEAYLMTGKAPTAELQSAFRKFAAWLKGIYASLTALDVELNDDITGVMDRMLAADESIKTMSELREMQPTLTSAEQAGMTTEEWTQYLADFAGAMEESEEKMRTRLMKEISVQKSREYKASKKSLTKQITEDVEMRPVYKALNFLRTGILPDTNDIPPSLVPNKMDRKAVKALFHANPKILLEMPRNITQKNGSDPDIVARYFGYGTAHEMITAFTEVVPQKQAIENEVQAALDQMYGDIQASAEAISDEANRALHNDKISAYHTKELRILSRKANRPVPTGFVNLAKMFADNIVAGQTVAQLRSSFKYLQAEQRAAKEAMNAAAKNDWEAAAEAKKQQIINHWIYRKAEQAKKEIDKGYTLAKKYTTPKQRARLGKAGPEYRNSMDALLEGVELKKVSQVELARRKTLTEYVNIMENTNGDVVEIPPDLLAAQGMTNYSEMTLEEFRALIDGVKNIAKLAYNKLYIDTLTGRIERDIATDALANSIYDSQSPAPERKKYRDGAQEGFRKLKNFIDTDLLKVEFLFRQLDGGEYGVWQQMIFEPLAKAQVDFYDKMAVLEGALMKPIKNMSSEQRSRLNKDYSFPGVNGDMKGTEILVVALNMGNASNMKKMIDGQNKLGAGWTEENLTEAIEGILMDEDFALMQHLWDEVNVFWEDIEKMAEKHTGLKPKKVEAQPITFNGKEYAGGYYPVIYDTRSSEMAEKHRVRKDADLFQNNLLRKNASSGFKEARTAVVDPILFDLYPLSSHFNEVIFYLTHFDAIDQAAKLIRSPKISRAFKDTIGKEYYDILEPWLQYIANQGQPPDGIDPYSKFMNNMATGVSVVSMAGGFSTAMIQPLGVFSTIRDIGYKSFLHGLANSFDRKQWKEANEQSNELRHLTKTFDRDARVVFERMLLKMEKKGQLKHWAATSVKWGYSLIGGMQYMVSMVSWIGAKRHGLEKMGYDDEKAAAYADSVVRTSQSSGALKDLANVQQREGSFKMFTAFYGYFAALYGQLRESGRKVGTKGEFMQGASEIVTVLLVAQIVEKVLRDGFPDDDEPWDEWRKDLAINTVTFATSTIPFFRDMVSYGISEYGYGFAPAAKIVERGINSGKKIFNDKDMTARDVQNLLKFTMTMSPIRVPTRPIIDSWKYIEAYMNGDIKEPFNEFIFGVK